jgi:hypothetical protein
VIPGAVKFGACLPKTNHCSQRRKLTFDLRIRLELCAVISFLSVSDCHWRILHPNSKPRWQAGFLSFLEM